MWKRMRAAVSALLERCGKGRSPAREEPAPGLDSWRRHVPAAGEILGSAVDLLLAVMANPDLGGPGYLTIQLSAGRPPVAAAQYPNITGILHHRILRRDLSPASLTAAGFPAPLLAYHPNFTAESGSMVLISVSLQELPLELTRALESREGQERVLTALAEALGRRYPALGIRGLGGELLLTPVRYRFSDP